MAKAQKPAQNEGAESPKNEKPGIPEIYAGNVKQYLADIEVTPADQRTPEMIAFLESYEG